jgi:ribonucleotide monophosphatase NagD (HAD superfamily)
MRKLTHMPPIIENAGELLARYQVIFCDIWGVVHNGETAYIEGCAALKRFRHGGGTVVFGSKPPRAPKAVARKFYQKQVPEKRGVAIV